MIFAIFALSLELLVGETGLVSFGHAAFFGVGAYATVLLSPQGRRRVALVAAAGGDAGRRRLYAALVGALSLRTRGVYFIMVTLAFAQMAYYVVPRHDARRRQRRHLPLRQAVAAAGDSTSRTPLTFYYVTLALSRRRRSRCSALRHALALRTCARRHPRQRAADARRRLLDVPYKLAAFVIAGALAGVAGLLYAVKDGFVNPEILSWHQSGTVLLMVILGGIGSLRGAVLGAFAFVAAEGSCSSRKRCSARFAKHWQLSLGLTIIVLVAMLPRGLMGIAAQVRRAREPR